MYENVRSRIVWLIVLNSVDLGSFNHLKNSYFFELFTTGSKKTLLMTRYFEKIEKLFIYIAPIQYRESMGTSFETIPES